MTDMTKQHLVWERGAKGPIATVWRIMDFGLCNHKKANIVSMDPLKDDEVDLPIEVLARLYPVKPGSLDD